MLIVVLGSFVCSHLGRLRIILIHGHVGELHIHSLEVCLTSARYLNRLLLKMHLLLHFLLVEKRTGIFEEAIFESFVVVRYVFNFIQVLSLKLKQSIRADNIPEDADFAGLRGRVKPELRC